MVLADLVTTSVIDLKRQEEERKLRRFNQLFEELDLASAKSQEDRAKRIGVQREITQACELAAQSTASNGLLRGSAGMDIFRAFQQGRNIGRDIRSKKKGPTEHEENEAYFDNAFRVNHAKVRAWEKITHESKVFLSYENN